MKFKILGWFFVFLIAVFCSIIIAWSEIFFGEQICDSGFENFWEEVTEKKLSEEELKFQESLKAIPLMNEKRDLCSKLINESCGRELGALNEIQYSLNICFYENKLTREECVNENILLAENLKIDIKSGKYKQGSEYMKNLRGCETKVLNSENCNNLYESSKKLESKKEIEPLRACTGSETIVYGIKFFTFNLIRAAIRAF